MFNEILTWEYWRDLLTHSQDFLAPTPIWDNLAVGNAIDYIGEVEIDWHSEYITSAGASGKLGAYVVASDQTEVRIYYVDDIRATSPTVTLLHTYHPFNPSNPYFPSTYPSIAVSRETDGLVGVLWKKYPNIYYGESTDGGDTWNTEVVVSASDSNTDQSKEILIYGFDIRGDDRFAVGFDTGAGEFGLFHSSNGTSFSKVSGSYTSNAFLPLPQITVGDDSRLYYTVPGAVRRITFEYEDDRSFVVVSTTNTNCDLIGGSGNPGAGRAAQNDTNDTNQQIMEHEIQSLGGGKRITVDWRVEWDENNPTTTYKLQIDPGDGTLHDVASFSSSNTALNGVWQTSTFDSSGLTITGNIIIRVLSVNRRNDGDIFSIDNLLVETSDTSKLYRVDDYGGTPTHTDITPAANAVPLYPYMFSVDPSDGERIAVIAEDPVGTRKLFTSTDGGDNWTDEGVTSDWGLIIADSSRLMFGYQNLTLSVDGGQTTQPKQGNILSDFYYTSLNRINGVAAALIVPQPAPEHDNFDGNEVAHALSEPTSDSGVGLRTGEKRLEITDIAVNTPAGPLAFTRTYRQYKQADASYQYMGLGWSHNHDIRLVEDTGASPNEIVARLGGGSEILFEKTDTDHYEGVAGASATIDVDTGSTSARYTLSASDGTVYVFEVYDTNKGRLVSRTFPSGEVWIYTYDGSGRLSTVVDDAYDLGGGVKRKLTFTYISGGSHDGQLYRVTDHTSRFVELAYSVDHDGGSYSLLDTVTDTRDNDWTYTYEDTISGQLNFLTEVQSPSVDSTGDGTADGVILLQEISYTMDGSTVTKITEESGAQGAAAALEETEFEFQPGGENLTTEKIANHTITHRFSGGVYAGSQDPAGNTSHVLGNGQYLPTIQVDPNGNAEQLQWDTDGKRLEKATDAEGHVTQMTYNSDLTLQQTTDAQGRKTTYLYNEGLRLPVMVLGSDDATAVAGLNGGMEADSDWTDVGSPTTNAQSTTQVDSGDYSRHVDAPNGAGIQSVAFSLTADKTYVIMARVYPISGTVKLNVNGLTGFDTTSQDTGDWETLRAVHTPTGSASRRLRFLADGGAAEFYVDSVHVVEVDSLRSWHEIIYADKGRIISESVIHEDVAVELQRVTHTYHTSGDGNGLVQSSTQHDLLDAGNNVTVTNTYDPVGRVIKRQRSSLFGTCSFNYSVYDDASNVIATVCSQQSVTPPTSIAEAEALYDAGDPDDKHNRVTVFTYDTLGRRVATRSDASAAFEQTQITAYDTLSRVIRTIGNYVSDVSITHPYTASHSAFDHGSDNTENLVTDTAYNERSLVRKTVDVLGNVTLFGYDAAGRVIKTVRNASNGSYDNTFAGDADLSAYVPAEDADLDIISETVYDANGNIVQRIDSLGVSDFTVYDGLNRVVKTVRDAKPEATIDLNPGDSGYDDENDPRSDNYVPSDDPDRDGIATTEYDAIGRVIRTRSLIETRPSAVWQTMLYGFDERGRSIKTVAYASDDDYDLSADPDLSAYSAGSGVDEDHITQTAYDDYGRVLYREDVNGNRTWTGYDGRHRVVKTIANAVGSATDGGSNDPRSGSYSPSSDADKDIISETFYDSDGRVQRTKDMLDRWTLFGYDEQGRQVKVIRNASDDDYFDTADPADPDLSEYSPSANSDEDIISETVFDDRGRVQQTIDTRDNVTYFVYDELGRQVLVIHNYEVQGMSDPEDWEWDANDARWEDGAGNAIDHGSDNDQNLISQTVYDVAGRVSQTRDMAGLETRQTYDATGRQIETIRNYVDGIYDPDDPDEDIISETVYNKAGQVLETFDARGTKTTMSYDAAGRRLTLTRAAETGLAATTYTCFDKAGRVLRSIRNWIDDGTDPDAQDGNGDWLFAPNNNGRLNDRNLITVNTYDQIGRRISVTDPLGQVMTTTYFKDGQMKSSTDPEGAVTQYRYDELRRPEKVVLGYQAQATDPEEWVWSVANSRWEEN